MSKIEKFLKTGHEGTVVAHIEKMKNPQHLLTATLHPASRVRMKAVLRMNELPEAKELLKKDRDLNAAMLWFEEAWKHHGDRDSWNTGLDILGERRAKLVQKK
ncbi:MAG TPA: hypothetical protein VGQ00_04670 [Candidatus Norongarragalinales archaeon]|jgi:hypothetical protein|nr:hypothetical protein [Candidatus Norongarragalinales archaeon]